MFKHVSSFFGKVAGDVLFAEKGGIGDISGLVERKRLVIETVILTFPDVTRPSVGMRE